MKQIQKIDLAFSRLDTILEASGALEAEATLQAVHQLRLEIARALGDAGRIKSAAEAQQGFESDLNSKPQVQEHPEAIALAKRLVDGETFISRLGNMKAFTYAAEGEGHATGLPFSEGLSVAVEIVLGCELEEFTHEASLNERCLRVPEDSLQQAKARVQAVLSGSDEVLPGASIAEIGHVDMLSILGEYDDPHQQPAWAWIEANASFSHTGNGDFEGTWEFILNLANHFTDVPPELTRVLVEAMERDLAYLVFHQG